MIEKTVECEHSDECKVSNRVLYYQDECESCDIARKFKQKAD